MTASSGRPISSPAVGVLLYNWHPMVPRLMGAFAAAGLWGLVSAAAHFNHHLNCRSPEPVEGRETPFDRLRAYGSDFDNNPSRNPRHVSGRAPVSAGREKPIGLTLIACCLVALDFSQSFSILR